MKEKPGWDKIKRPVYLQKKDASGTWATPKPTSLQMSVKEFVEKYPGYETGITTICAPPKRDYIANINENESYWITISAEEIFEDY